jgi:Suppressor of fused protein (SUFU)
VTLPAPLPAVEAALCEHFGQVPQRASVSFLGLESIEVLRFEPVPAELAYVTLGMARHPMSGSADRVDSGPRAELLIELRDPADRYVQVWRQLAVLAAAPAVEGVVYAAGSTVDLERPLAAASRCTGGVVTASALAPVEAIPGPVSVLQLWPATSVELAWCRVHGSAALQQRWADRGTDLLDLGRNAVALD